MPSGTVTPWAATRPTRDSVEELQHRIDHEAQTLEGVELAGVLCWPGVGP
jgi:hypothetical protein